MPALLAAQEPAGAEAIEEIVVTGSRIKRRDFTSISPIATVDAEQITFGGITNLEDLARDLPQLVPNLDRTSNNPGNGAAQLDLRGLGPGRTLVMLNGRRAAPHDVFGAVDVNGIPSALVERVEVVSGGASAVYGSDAVSGAVNFILDTDFTGMEFSAQYDVFGAGDGDAIDANLSFGSDFGGGRGHVMGFFNFQDREAVMAADREFTRVSLSENFESPVGELVEGGSTGTPAGFVPRQGLPPVTFEPDGTPRPFVFPDDLYNFQPANYLQVPHRRKMAGLFGNFSVTDSTSVFTELLWSASETSQQLAPSTFAGLLAINVDHPSLTPVQRELLIENWQPDGAGIVQLFMSKRLAQAGPRRRGVDSDSLRAVAGMEGSFGFGWDWEVSYSHSTTDKEKTLANGAYRSRLQQGLLADPVTGECFDPSGGCVPLSLFGENSVTPEALQFLRAEDIADSEKVTEQIVSLNATGDVFDLPGGVVTAAFGAEWRDLSGKRISDPNLIGGGVLGWNSDSNVDGSFDVKELYAEVLVPLATQAAWADYLGIEAGARYSAYSVAGNAWNWKLGIDWAPFEGFRVRMMQQRATRAPNINELFREPVEAMFPELGLLADECSASRDPVASGVADLCIAQGVPAGEIGIFEAAWPFPVTLFFGGGNPNLDPEEADTLTAGIVVQPASLPELSLAIDYYEIEIANAIAGVSALDAVGLCFDSNDIDSDQCRAIVRGPSGDIVQLTNPQFNLAKSKARGIDVIVDYRRELGPRFAIGSGEAALGVRFFGTHALETGWQRTPDTPFIDCAGYFGGLCGSVDGNFIAPKNRTNTRLTWYSGRASVSLDWQWIGELENHIGIRNAIVDGPDLASEIDKVGARNYIDLSAGFELNESMELYGGVSNVFEEGAPLLGMGATQANTAPQLYDVFGRRFFLGFSYRR